MTHRVDWVAAWPWNGDTVAVSITRSGTQAVHDFTASAGESDSDFAARIIRELERLQFT